MTSSDLTDQKKADSLLKAHIGNTIEQLEAFFDKAGLNTQSLAAAFGSLRNADIPIQEDIVCENSCNYCCHLRVGASIPETIAIYHQICSNMTKEGYQHVFERIMNAGPEKELAKESYWLETQTPCPFLDSENTGLCLIYDIRPFACRAFHSLDKSACKKGFETRKTTQIPCYPLYRSFIDGTASAFIHSVKKNGMVSYQVGFIKALKLLMDAPESIDQWLSGKDVFITAKAT